MGMFFLLFWLSRCSAFWIDPLSLYLFSPGKQSADRLGQLEQAVPLAEHFQDAHSDLLTWLDDMEQQVAEHEAQSVALNPQQIKDQQDAVKVG